MSLLESCVSSFYGSYFDYRDTRQLRRVPSESVEENIHGFQIDTYVCEVITYI